MDKESNLIEFILPSSGEVVYAGSLCEAREKLARFHYTHEELDSIVNADDYIGKLTHNGRFWE